MSIYRSNSTHQSSTDLLSRPTTRDSFENTSFSRYRPQKSIHHEKSKERLELERIMSTSFKRESEETKPDISFNNSSNLLEKSQKFNDEGNNSEKFNENSIHFAKILNQIVDKICNDIENRLSRMEIRMEVLERIAKNHEERTLNKENIDRNSNLSQRGGKKTELEHKILCEIQWKFKKFEEKLENLENYYSDLKSEVFMKHNQISTTLDTNLQKFLGISEVLNKKLTNFSKKKPEIKEDFFMKDLEKRLKELEKIKDNLVENEINSENQRALLGKLEDDVVRMISSMKDINELVMISRLNSSEILALKSKHRDLFDCVARLTEKRANSQR